MNSFISITGSQFATRIAVHKSRALVIPFFFTFDVAASMGRKKKPRFTTRLDVPPSASEKNDDLQRSKLLRRNKTVNRPTQYVGQAGRVWSPGDALSHSVSVSKTSASGWPRD